MVILQLLLQLGLLGAVIFLIWIQRVNSKENNKNLTAIAEFQVKTSKGIADQTREVYNLVAYGNAHPTAADYDAAEAAGAGIAAAGAPEPSDRESQAADSPETLPVAPESMESPELIPGFVVRVGCGVIKQETYPDCLNICPWDECIATMEVRHYPLNPPAVFDFIQPGDPQDEADPETSELLDAGDPGGNFCFIMHVTDCSHLREDGTCYGECANELPQDDNETLDDDNAAGDPDNKDQEPALGSALERKPKPKRVMSPAQKEALEKGRQTRKDNIAKRKDGNS